MVMRNGTEVTIVDFSGARKYMLLIPCLILFLGIMFVGFRLYLTMIYPLRYTEEIKIYSEINNLDPYLVAAIIKVESGFRANVVSPRGAVGLMQIMPTTGAWVAEMMEFKEYSYTSLSDPETNIAIGTWYLSNLMSNFDNQIPVVLAAYTGGQGEVRRWFENGIWSGSFEDIDHIPFSETREFVKRVLISKAQYKSLYPHKLE